jgi:hypothetical protein
MRSMMYLAVIALGGAACGSSDDGVQETPFDVTAQLQLDQPMPLQLGDELHTFTLLQQRPERALVKIESEPKTWTFMPGIGQEIDFNGEGGPDAVVDVTINGDGTVTIHIVSIIGGSGMSGSSPVKPLDWDTPVSPEPPGTVLQRLMLVANNQEPPSILYPFMPQKDTCDQSDSTLYDAYVIETGGKMRIQHTPGSSPGFPYFEMYTTEQRSRFIDCSNGGYALQTKTELMLDEKRGADLDGNGTIDVDAVLHRVQFSSNYMPTLEVLIYARP